MLKDFIEKKYSRIYDGEKYIYLNSFEDKKVLYEIDLEIKSLIFKDLQKIEDILREKLKEVIKDEFFTPSIFKSRHREKRLSFVKNKLKFLSEKNIKPLNYKKFFDNLSFWELIYYFQDLKIEYKNKVNDIFHAKKIYLLESWLNNIRLLRNLVCHWENIINRKFEESIASKYLLYMLKRKKNNHLIHYLIITELFKKSLNSKINRFENNLLEEMEKVILKQKNNLPVLDHILGIKPKIEGWEVFLHKIYIKYFKNQEKTYKKNSERVNFVKILRFIDKYLFWFFSYLFFWLKYIPFNKEKYIKNPKKILVIRLWALWSSILTFPLIKQLKENYPNSQIDLLATSRNIWVFKNQWYFNNIYNLFSKDLIKLIFSFKKYDIVIDTEEYFRLTALISLWLGKFTIWFGEIPSRKLVYNCSTKYEWKHHVIEYLKFLNCLWKEYKIPEKLEPLKYFNKAKEKVDSFLKNYEWKIKIVMHTAGAETSPDRFWSQEKWEGLINKVLEKYGDKVVIFLSWTNFEKEQVDNLLKKVNSENVISLVNQFNLEEFAYFLKNVDLMISNDTWPMHLAACMGTKTIWLFGPNIPERFGAYPLDKNINIYKGNWKVYIKVMEGKFEEDKERNIEKIQVDDVLDAIEEILKYKLS